MYIYIYNIQIYIYIYIYIYTISTYLRIHMYTNAYTNKLYIQTKNVYNTYIYIYIYTICTYNNKNLICLFICECQQISAQWRDI